MKHIIAILIVAPITAALFYWYVALWFPRLDIAYWSQALPVAVVAVTVIILCDDSPASKLEGALLGLLFMISLITQTLVWVSVIPHPNF